MRKWRRSIGRNTFNNVNYQGEIMKKSTYALDSKLLVKIGRLIDPCFTLIEADLVNNTMNQFTCSVSDLSKEDFKEKMDRHFAGCLTHGGLYIFRVTTSEYFNVTDFKTDWDNSRSSIVGKKPKSNATHCGQCIIHEQTTSNEYILYVGSSLNIGSRIKEHFLDCDTSKSTYCLRLRCSTEECLKHIFAIRVNYITFEGLSDNNDRETALQNLCRYFEKKMNQKYQALIGE